MKCSVLATLQVYYVTSVAKLDLKPFEIWTENALLSKLYRAIMEQVKLCNALQFWDAKSGVTFEQRHNRW